MPVGLDDASAVAGLVTCSVALLNGCIKGFVVLSRARTCSRQISNIDLNFGLEQLKLCYWAEQAGLFETPAQLRLAQPFVECVPRILEQLQELLNDVHQLRTVYHLDLEETSEEITDPKPEDSVFHHLQLRQLPEVQRLNSNVTKAFAKKLTPWLKVRWLAVDEAHYRALLDDVGRLTGHLLQLPRPSKSDSVENTFETLYRTAVMRNNTASDLSVLIESCQDTFLTAIAAPARLKRKSILSGLFRRTKMDDSVVREPQQVSLGSVSIQDRPSSSRITDNAISRELDSKRLRVRHLTLPDNIQPHTVRQLAYYEDQPVLIEWRSVDSHYWNKMQDRAARFCGLLSEMARYPSFHSLPCRGFVRETQTGRYGYVFELGPDMAPDPAVASSNPRQLGTSRRPLPVLRTLRGLLDSTTWVPSFNVRLSYAIVLLETILQLHTAEWLHKELRSDNVLLIAQGVNQYLDRELLDSPIYLAGYPYARADDPSDFTEPMKSAMDTDLYRHPLSLLGDDRRSYCRSFDVFSVGCVLLELGLWSSMSSILSNMLHKQDCLGSRAITSSKLKSVTPPPDSPHDTLNNMHEYDDVYFQGLRQDLLAQVKEIESVPGGVVKHLEAQVGHGYTKIVVDFLNVKTAGWDENLGPSEHEYILDLEQRALDQLRGLAERL